MLVIANNPSYQDAERTFLTDPISTADVAANVKSTANFAVNEFIVVGNPGQEKTEMRQIGAVASDVQFTIDAADYPHSTDDPVILSRFNQIKIYRATSSGGTFSLLTTVAIQVDNPNSQTVYDDTTGATTNYYKVSYYNSQSTLETAQSDEIPGTGYGSDTAAFIIDAILEEANDKDEQITTRKEVMRWINDCNTDVRSRRKEWEFWKEDDTVSLAASSYIIPLSQLSKTFMKMDHVRYNYVSGSTDITYRLREVSLAEMQVRKQDNNATEDDKLKVFSLDFKAENILVDPTVDTAQTSNIVIRYDHYPTRIDSEGDVVEIPNTTTYHNYGLWRFHVKKKSDAATIKYYKDEYERAVFNLVRVNDKRSNQPRSMNYKPAGWRGNYRY